MTRSDWEFFKAELQHFAVVHGKTIGQELAAAYWADLNAMPREAFERACLRLRRTAQWFPKPSEFITCGVPQWM